MNILICSTGSRVKMIQYIKETIQSTGGKVVAGDSDPILRLYLQQMIMSY